jgi:HlyD family secretion protein
MTRTTSADVVADQPPIHVADDIRRPMLVGLSAFLLFFGGLGGWASTLQLDGAVIAQGSIKVQDNRLTMQHREGGTVKALLVKEGDRVEADQVLIRLGA